MPRTGLSLGVYGGTFDPIHNGHLHVAAVAVRALGLDQLLLVPNGRPAHRPGSQGASPAHRLAMARLAAQPYPFLGVSDMEVTRPGISYTAETLEALAALHPGCRLTFITGVDAVAELPTWRRPERILELSAIIAAARPGYSRAWLAERLPAAWLERITLLEETDSAVSATEVRRRLAAGTGAEALLPASVLAYIRRHGLYRGEDVAAAASNLPPYCVQDLDR